MPGDVPELQHIEKRLVHLISAQDVIIAVAEPMHGNELATGIQRIAEPRGNLR